MEDDDAASGFSRTHVRDHPDARRVDPNLYIRLSAKREFPTPGSPRDPKSALQIVLSELSGRGSTKEVADVRSVSYVVTTVGEAIRIVGQEKRSDLNTPLDTRAWLFVAYGSFRYAPMGGQSESFTTSYAIAWDDWPGVYSALTNDCYDLRALGTPIVIPRGQVPELDAVRAVEDGECEAH